MIPSIMTAGNNPTRQAELWRRSMTSEELLGRELVGLPSGVSRAPPQLSCSPLLAVVGLSSHQGAPPALPHSLPGWLQLPLPQQDP